MRGMTMWDNWHMPPHDQCDDPHRWQLQVHNGLKHSVGHVTDWSLAVDGGAFIGMWTKPLAYMFKRVVAFEPNPAAYACLEYNCRNLSNVTLVNKALGHEAREKVGIHDTAPGPSVNLLQDDQQDKARTFVEMVTLDSQGLTPSYLKLDLEGYEFRALQGARESVMRGRPVIVVEHSGHGTRYQSPGLDKFFRPMGYELQKDGDDQVWTWQLKT
jgi:FkbM family methyltransferase